METPFSAYRGDDRFVFICYSHGDAADVYPEIERLDSEGVNVWYDEGIRPGSEWTDELASAITRCSKFIFFVTVRSVQSRHCRDEVQYALKQGIPIIVIYLEKAELPPGLELVLGSIQAIFRDTADPSRHLNRLLEAIWEDVARDDLAKSGIGHVPAPAVQTRKLPQLRPPRKLPRMVPVAVLLVLSLGGLYYWTRDRGVEVAPVLLVDAHSIAVLPFEDRGGFENEAYYPDSVSEDLLNRLSGIDQLSVASRRSSFQYRNQDTEQIGLVEIASRLGVSSVLSGYIRREGSSIRLSLELVDVSSGREFVRWSNSYDDRPIADMLVVQAEITRAVADKLLPNGLSAQLEQRLVRQSTKSIQAYEYYLQAKEILREPLAEFASLTLASDLFSKAISLDGGFAWAKAGLCASNTLAYRVGGSFDAMAESCDRLIGIDTDLFDVRLALGDFYLNTGKLRDADVELKAAVKLNPNSAEAKISLAELHAERFYESQKELDRIRAEEAYLEAVAAEPEYWFVYHSYANYLTRQNRLEDALVQMKKALVIKPMALPTLNNLGNMQYRLGLTSQAEETWKKSLSINSNNRWAHSGLGIMYHYKRQFDLAVEHFEAACEISPEDHELWGLAGQSYRLLDGKEKAAQEAFERAAGLAEKNLEINQKNWRTTGFLALYYAYLGRLDDAEATIQLMFELNPGADPLTHYFAAMVAYEQEDIDRVFTELDLALANGFKLEKQFIEDEPALESLRSDYSARFVELLARY